MIFNIGLCGKTAAIVTEAKNDLRDGFKTAGYDFSGRTRPTKIHANSNHPECNRGAKIVVDVAGEKELEAVLKAFTSQLIGHGLQTIWWPLPVRHDKKKGQDNAEILIIS